MKNIIFIIIVTVIAGSSGYALQKYLNQPQIQPQIQTRVNPAIGLQRPEFAAVDLNGQFRNIKEWDGKLIFLNFWATWCPPCLKEIPEFIELQKTYGDQGFQIIGIAIDDEEAVREYVKEVGMNYPALVVQNEGVMLAKRYGNGIGVLPYTVIINRGGEISHTIRGELSKIRAKELMEERGIQL
ncbi:MAG: thiol-disulfide oxidoreductase ResA [Gammaproteobacteria bacterium]|nr:MAG: thiol-disulfide oxidoreductase ResA [Gammaproteobacteria bacterium]